MSELKFTKNTVSKIPQTDGVYLFYEKGTVIYVGKSLNLKARIATHIEGAKVDAKEAAIITSYDSISIIPVESEFKSLILESELIKKYRPKYNKIWKDDKSYLYVKITIKDTYPKIYAVRRENDGKSLYFGPFPSHRVVNQLLKSVRRVIPFCTQKKLSKTPCFYSKIGLCKPCPNYINRLDPVEKEHYKKVYTRNIRQVIKVFKGDTEIVLKNLREQLKILTRDENFEEAIVVRNQLTRFERLIYERQGLSGERNVYSEPFERLAELELFMAKYFPSISKLTRIECYDISNFQHKEATASMVVLINGQTDKAEYRKFKIKNLLLASDFEMLDEVIKRRFKNNWDKPDLIVVDGGKPQVRTILRSLSEIGKDSIPVIGIAKNPDRLVIGRGNLDTVRLPQSHQGFNLIRYIRDESHRFAKKYHVLLRNKRMML